MGRMRCPLRVAALDLHEECDPDCAWLLCLANNKDHRECAMAVNAVANPHVAWVAVNHVTEEDGK